MAYDESRFFFVFESSSKTKLWVFKVLPLVPSRFFGKISSVCSSLIRTITALLLPLLACPPCTAQFYSPGVKCVAFSPDGKVIASGGFDNKIKLWEVASGKQVGSLSCQGSGLCAVAFSPDGKLIACGTMSDTVELWDVSSEKELQCLTEHSEAWIHSVAFSPDGNTLAWGEGKVINLWDLVSAKKMKCLTGHSDQVSAIAFSPDGKTLASGSDDKTIKLWPVLSGRKPRTLNASSPCILAVAFSPDGRMLANGSCEKTIKLWDVASGKEVCSLTGAAERIISLAFNPDGKTLVSGTGDKYIDVWDVATHTSVRRLTGHSNWVDAVAFSHDGKTLVSGSRDDTIRLWDTVSGEMLQTIANRGDGGQLVAPIVPKPGYMEGLRNAIEFNYKVMFCAILLLIMAAVCAVILLAGVSFLTRGATKQRTTVILAATLLPFGCFMWSAAVFEFQAAINKTVLNRDPLIGEICQCPLPNGYALFMCDVTEYGMLYNQKKHSDPSVSRMEWKEPSGHLEVQTDGVENVRKLQLFGPYVFGSSDSAAPDHRLQIDKADSYFVLNTVNDQKTEFAPVEELQREATKRGVRLELQPIYAVYRHYRFTWFDTLAAILLFVPPFLSFSGLVWWIRQLRKNRRKEIHQLSAPD